MCLFAVCLLSLAGGRARPTGLMWLGPAFGRATSLGRDRRVFGRPCGPGVRRCSMSLAGAFSVRPDLCTALHYGLNSKAQREAR